MSRESTTLHGRDPPPPPSARLLAALSGMRPVRTRRPLRSLTLVAAAAVAAVGVAIGAARLRADLPYLPLGWVLAVAVVWSGAFAVLLRVVLLPPRGRLAPDGPRVLYLTAALLGVLVAVAFTAPVDAPGHTRHPTSEQETVRAAIHCGVRAGALALAPMLLSMAALRHAIPLGSWRAGAAIGAMGGSLAGFALHLICPYGGLHVGVAHAGSALVCALLGALIFPALNR